VTRWLAAACALCPVLAYAQVYPAKTVRIVVPSSPGGIIDLVSRLVAQQMSAQTGQPVVIDNRAGASTNIGTEAVARAQPDGYTVLSTTLTLVVNPSMFPQLAYSAERDFAPVSMLVAAPYAIVVHPAVPAKDIRALVALAKASPGKLNYASGGNGTNFHVSAELLQYHTGIRLAHVPYKGGGPALASVLGGETDMTIPSLAAALPHVRSGRVRALAITTAQRSPLVPDLPTVAESGVPEYAFSSWVGMLLPAGTPPNIVAALHDQAVKAVRSREVSGRLAADGTQIVAGSPAQFADYIRREIPRWAQVVKARAIVAQ
jgi:tripartite-type tricarboxylate transporter receptor subunit TctC